MKKFTLNPALSIAMCAVLWSTGGLFIKLVDWNPFAIAGIRSLLAGCTIMLVLRRLPHIFVYTRDDHIDYRDMQNKILAALFNSLAMIFFVLATKLTTAANAIILQYTEPIYLIIFTRFFLDEKIYLIDYVTVAGVLFGLLLFFFDELSAGKLLGNIMGLLSGVCFAFYCIFLRRQKDSDPIDSMIISNLFTALLTVPFWLAAGIPSVSGCISLLILGVFQIGCADILFCHGIKGVSALSAGLICFLEGIMNPVWVVIFYGEIPSVCTIAGGLIIMGMIILRTVIKNRRYTCDKNI
ncbi:MAG: DMT family transporter [Spirochaetia bacterium]|nr:DMT family transporter [Spirochaetia bacterium]